MSGTLRWGCSATTVRNGPTIVRGDYMSGDPPADEVRNPSGFEAALEDLLATAVRNDIDLRGSWVCETDDGRNNWEVIVHELE